MLRLRGGMQIFVKTPCKQQLTMVARDLGCVLKRDMATLFLVVCATWVALAPGAYAQSFSNDTFIVPDVIAHDTMFGSLGVELETGTDPTVTGGLLHAHAGQFQPYRPF